VRPRTSGPPQTLWSKTVTEHDDGSRALLRGQRSSERRRLLQHGEIVTADDRAVGFLRRMSIKLPLKWKAALRRRLGASR
jgi:hypothetical protein